MTDRPRRRWPRVLLAVVAVLVVAFAGLVLALDRILLSQARRQADVLSRDLGRPVTVGGVATKLWGGLGVRVTDLSVGPGAGEDRPLVELRRAEVRVDVLRAAFTMGKEVHVLEAVVEGLRVNVVKLPGGTTNVERVTDALAKRAAGEEKEAPAKPPEAAKEPALRVLRVDRAAVENARIAFLDRTVPGAKELYVDDLDVEVRDLETGKPVEVVLRAAVLQEKQNVLLQVKAAPLPASLQPVPEEVVLKVEPIVLDPLAPFLGKEVGFRGGRFEADLDARLGAAVPGGAGPTRVKGGFHATRLAFAGQEGGKALDAGLDADLDADMAKGDLRIGRLDLSFGPAGFTGRGKASGLRGDSPRLDGLEIVGHGLDPEALAAYYPPIRKQLAGAVVAGPVGLTVRGSGTQAAQTVEIRADLTPVRLDVPDELAKAAGAPMVLVARADLGQGGGRARFDVSIDLAGVDLRPGGTLAKKPGDPLSVKLAGTSRTEGDARELHLDRVDVAVLSDRLQGTGEARLAGKGAAATTRFQADLRGDRLDLDRLLLPSSSSAKAKKAKKESASDPKAYAGLSGTATMRLGTVRMKGMDAHDVTVRAVVKDDEVRLEEARLEAFGGKVSAAGTHLAVARPEAPFEVALALDHVGAEDLLKMLGNQKVLTGTIDAKVGITGKGWKAGLLTASATGGTEGTLRGGTYRGKDLLAAVASPLAAKLPFAASRLPDRQGTPLGKDLPFALRLANGVATLTKPLGVETGDGTLSVEGGVRIDGTLEMPATVSLSPDLVARITGGRARPGAPIPVTFRIAGPAWSPRIEGLALDGAVKAIVQQAAAGALGRLVGGGQGSTVDEKKAGAEQRARDAAEEQRKKLEEEAKKKLKGLFGR